MNHRSPVWRASGFSASLLLAILLSACGGDKPDAMLASAKDYLAKNDSKAAVIQLKNALQKNPELPEARYLLGLALLRGGDAVGGETELRKALAFKHPQEAVAPALAQAMLAQGKFAKVTDEFSRTELSQAAAKADLQTSLAAAYGAQGKAELAFAALRAALAADPGYVPALILQARQKAAAQDIEGALALVESILTKAPGTHEAWKLKGDILLHGKDQANEAIVAYRKAIEAKADYLPGHAATIAALMQMANVDEAAKQLEQLKKVAPNRPQTRYFETALAYQKKDFRLARELAPQLIRMAPNNAQGLYLAGAIEFQANSLLQAELYLTKAVQNAPQSALARRLLVKTYLRSGQSAKALVALQPALKADIVDANTSVLAGEAYLQNGDAKRAEEFFTKAIKSDPKNAKSRTSLALTQLLSGREESAFGDLQEIAASDSGTTADMAVISVYLQRKEYDKALKAIDSLEKKQPDKPLAANLRARTLLAKRDVAGARKSFERALDISPGYFPALASLVSLDMLDKKPDEGRKRLEAVLAKDPKNPQVLLALVELRARSGASNSEVAELLGRAIAVNPTETRPRLLLVELHLRDKEAKQALTVAQNAVAAIPDSPELLDALGRAQQASGDTNQAIATYSKMATLQPLALQPHLRLAEAHMVAKDKNAAAASLRKALELQPDLLDAQRALIGLALEEKKFQQAVTIAREIQKQRPKEDLGYLLEGSVSVAQQKWDVAAEAFRFGLKQVPAPELAAQLHSVLAASGKTTEALKFSNGWLKDNPKDAAFRFYLGDAALVRKDYAAAEKSFLSVVQIQPDSVLALNNLAWVTGKLNKEGAIAYAEKANTLAPNQPLIMDTLAMLLSEKNEYAKALEWQNKALALQPQNRMFKLNLAKIHAKGGKKDLARKELDELAKLGDKFPAQAEVESLLKSL